MSEALEARLAALEAENARLREELAARSALANRALASYQQRALQMEIIRQQNEELGLLAKRLAEAKQEEERRGAERLQLIERLEIAVRALSTPILQIWPGVLALPVIGALDRSRASEMLTRLLQSIESTGSRVAVLDVTGLDEIDDQVASHLIQIVRSVELMGARGIITGVNPAVAQTVTALGLDLSGVVTLRNLEEGLRMSIRWTSAEGGQHTATR